MTGDERVVACMYDALSQHGDAAGNAGQVGIQRSVAQMRCSYSQLSSAAVTKLTDAPCPRVMPSLYAHPMPSRVSSVPFSS